jgi:DNA modification methylase
LGDNCITRQQYADLCNNWINTINPYLADYNSIYAFGISESVIPYYQHPELHISNTLIWVKQNAVLGRMDYNCQHEVIVYAWVGKHKFYGPTNATTVINYPKPFKSELHPTMKPVGLIAQLITNSSTEKQIVYDAFAGSGTTLIACEQLNRKCRAMELSPHYCSVIIKRWENLTQKKAEKIT